MQAPQLKGCSLAQVAVASCLVLLLLVLFLLVLFSWCCFSWCWWSSLFHPHSLLLQFIPLLKLFFTVFPQGLTASGGGGGVMLGIPASGCLVICGYIQPAPLHQPLLSVTGWCTLRISPRIGWRGEGLRRRGAQPRPHRRTLTIALTSLTTLVGDQIILMGKTNNDEW